MYRGLKRNKREDKRMKIVIKYGFPVGFCLWVIVFALFTFLLLNKVMVNQPPFVPYVATFSIDGMCLIWFIGDHFHRKENGETAFLTSEAHNIVKFMYIFCFAISAFCSLVFNELWLNHFDWSQVPPIFSTIVDWIIPIVFFLNALVFYRLYHLEHMAQFEMRSHRVLNPPAPRIIAPRQHNPPITSVTRMPVTQELPASKVENEEVILDSAEEDLDEYDWAGRAEQIVVQKGSNVHEPGCKCVGCRPDLHRRKSGRGRPSIGGSK